MKHTETTNEGLKRAYKLAIPATEIDARIESEIKKVAPRMNMPGFRPGKVPANLVRKMHGEQMHAQALNDTIRESVDHVMATEKLRPAMQPKIELGEDYEQGKDAEVSLELEILPEISTPDTKGLKLEKLVVPVTDKQVDEAVENFAKNQKNFSDAPKGRKAKDGDQLIIDFLGKLDGTPFEGGKAEGAPLELGSGQFIPGFEEQLVGAKSGDEKVINVTFPADYQAKHLAGKDVTFDITVQAVKVAGDVKIDDEFAKGLGLDSLDKLKELLRGQLEQETAGMTRTAMKRSLLDHLAGSHDFEVPEGMVDAEFDQIWQQLQQEASREEDPAAALKEVEAEKDDYRNIAERRVRLGLLLSEIGQQAGVEVSQQEMQMLMQQAAQQYPADQREQFFQFVQNEPMAAAQIRAPLYEDKVVDHLFETADVKEREVTRDELQAAIEAEDTAPAQKKKAPATKKAPAKKATSTKADEKPVAKKAPGKKAAATKADEASAMKPPAKKSAAKKPAAKKASPKKASEKKK
ncbi:trigger factor [Altererythrobacter aquiaggeris]|uniref:trigger factor n=1 Tax=Aestuarierythrobacter aquiaggeris TaxID=1898396 RepID=UPI003019CBF4